MDTIRALATFLFSTKNKSSSDLNYRMLLGAAALAMWNPMIDLLFSPTYEWVAFTALLFVLAFLVVGGSAVGERLARLLTS